MRDWCEPPVLFGVTAIVVIVGGLLYIGWEARTASAVPAPQAEHLDPPAPAPSLACTPLPQCHGASGCCRAGGTVVHDPCRRVDGCGERMTCEALPWCPAVGGCCEAGLRADGRRVTVVAPCGEVAGCATLAPP